MPLMSAQEVFTQIYHLVYLMTSTNGLLNSATGLTKPKNCLQIIAFGKAELKVSVLYLLRTPSITPSPVSCSEGQEYPGT